jgi:hypothetical protein
VAPAAVSVSRSCSVWQISWTIPSTFGPDQV